MAVSIGSVMRHCRNYFQRGYIDGEFHIVDGALEFPALADGRYIAISGSALNDGVHHIGDAADKLQDETFIGRVWMLYPPASFLDLCAEISEYDDKNPAGAYVSESFGEYSYSRGTKDGVAGDWQTAFFGRLTAYQLLRSEVML